MALETRGEVAAGMWCRNNPPLCKHIWWCGPGGYFRSTILGVVIFGGLFVLLMLGLHPVVKPCIDRWPSTDKAEEAASWFAWHVQSVIHATTVSCMAVVAIWHLSSMSSQAKFDTPAEAYSNIEISALAGNAAHVFFSFLLVDTLVTFARRSMTADYFAHHVVFCSFCLLIQYDCYAPYLASWLLLMEVSTIFLNGFSFLRHRLGYGHNLVKAFFIAFSTSFMVCRLFGTTYIAISFTTEVYRGEVLFIGIPRWRLQFVCAALMAAIAIQCMWAVAIGKKLLKIVAKSKTDTHAGGVEQKNK